MASIITSAADAAHSAAVNLLSAAQVTVGASIHDKASGKKVKASGNPTEAIDFSEKLKEGRVVVVGVPGAFTPSCNNQAPGYISNAAAFIAKGITAIYIVAVNDAFVVQAWKEKLTEGKDTPAVHFIADDKGEFVSSLGLVFDASPLLGGPRSKRFVLVADQGKVTHVAVEPSPADVTITRAETFLAQL
ncbi:Redoxin [Fomitiporia mediterranea MF3/22]|uniref:Redoxin n=1 Tax=Fomitiporia mediterranea (strain MF3/22) TaxID=694068 RepID=UPI00044089A9|nr:Redoxin [Fomitiporia mediterranea MF3/22]EJD00450.1 Redoxin [Fomitiporia mediterranea MF3/22]